MDTSTAGTVDVPLLDGAATLVVIPVPLVVASAVSVDLSPVVSVAMVWVSLRRWVGVWYFVLGGGGLLHLRRG